MRLPADRQIPQRPPEKYAHSWAYSGHNANDENIIAIGGRNQLLQFSDDGAPCNDCDARKTGATRALDGAGTDRGQIKAAILRWLWRFDHDASAAWRSHAAVRAHLCNACEHGIGPFRCLHRQYVAAGHDDGLPDVEPPGSAQIVEAEINIGAVAFRYRDASESALGHENFRRNLMSADQVQTFILEHLAHARQQMIVTTTIRRQDAS